MTDSGFSRRAFMAVAAGAGGALLATNWAETAEAAERSFALAQQEGRARYKVLTQEEAADVIALTSVIFPSDETPGAKEAGVVFFVDQAASKDKELAKGIRGTLTSVNAEVAKRWPGKTRVAKLGADEQHTLMTVIEKEMPPAFGLLKGMTVTGMFSMPSRGGNRNKTGWKLLGFKDQFSWQAPFGWYDGEGAK